MPERKFGKYEVLARLATGGVASIFLARQPGVAGFHKLVCLKTLLPERASDRDFVSMFLDEARLAARLNHPNCVQIYDLGRERGSFYISMEYIFGETLWDLLATVTKLRAPLPVAQVASIISSACDGLQHAHELKDSTGRPYNLVHRDVSPQNIMVSFEGQTKVLDFGIAKAETGRTPTNAGVVKGKFSYMSPEQIKGTPVDRRSDVYALGIVLFECLASRRLYRGEAPEEIARMILEHRPPRLKDVIADIPLALDAICANALARNPSKRYQTAQAMGDALREYLEDVRYNQGRAGIAKLVEERFGEHVAERKKAFEGALSGVYEESQLLRALDARSVREMDLFVEESPREGDFQEPAEAGTGEESGSGRLEPTQLAAAAPKLNGPWILESVERPRDSLDRCDSPDQRDSSEDGPTHFDRRLVDGFFDTPPAFAQAEVIDRGTIVTHRSKGGSSHSPEVVTPKLGAGAVSGVSGVSGVSVEQRAPSRAEGKGLLNGGFTFPALFASLCLGVAVGIIIGMLLARTLFFDEARSVPSTPPRTGSTPR